VCYYLPPQDAYVQDLLNTHALTASQLAASTRWLTHGRIAGAAFRVFGVPMNHENKILFVFKLSTGLTGPF
jgi:hypothetical protein